MYTVDPAYKVPSKKTGAGIEAVGLFESIHLFVYKLMLQNAISGVKRRARLCSICCNIV
jgi:hypothetical protein